MCTNTDRWVGAVVNEDFTMKMNFIQADFHIHIITLIMCSLFRWTQRLYRVGAYFLFVSENTPQNMNHCLVILDSGGSCCPTLAAWKGELFQLWFRIERRQTTDTNERGKDTISHHIPRIQLTMFFCVHSKFTEAWFVHLCGHRWVQLCPLSHISSKRRINATAKTGICARLIQVHKTSDVHFCSQLTWS